MSTSTLIQKGVKLEPPSFDVTVKQEPPYGDEDSFPVALANLTRHDLNCLNYCFICQVENTHDTRRCPALICNKCLTAGHARLDCPEFTRSHGNEEGEERGNYDKVSAEDSATTTFKDKVEIQVAIDNQAKIQHDEFATLNERVSFATNDEPLESNETRLSEPEQLPMIPEKAFSNETDETMSSDDETLVLFKKLLKKCRKRRSKSKRLKKALKSKSSKNDLRNVLERNKSDTTNKGKKKPTSASEPDNVVISFDNSCFPEKDVHQRHGQWIETGMAPPFESKPKLHFKGGNHVESKKNGCLAVDAKRIHYLPSQKRVPKLSTSYPTIAIVECQIVHYLSFCQVLQIGCTILEGNHITKVTIPIAPTTRMASQTENLEKIGFFYDRAFQQFTFNHPTRGSMRCLEEKDALEEFMSKFGGNNVHLFFTNVDKVFVPLKEAFQRHFMMDSFFSKFSKISDLKTVLGSKSQYAKLSGACWGDFLRVYSNVFEMKSVTFTERTCQDISELIWVVTDKVHGTEDFQRSDVFYQYFYNIRLVDKNDSDYRSKVELFQFSAKDSCCSISFPDCSKSVKQEN